MEDNGHNGLSLPDGQMVLIEAESDEALLMPVDKRQNLFTGALANKIADRLDMILALISCRLPIEEVARRAHVSTHTVRELIGQHATMIASDMDKYAGWTAGLSAKFLMLADLKSDTANFKDLVTAHSFVGKLSMDMKLASLQLRGTLPDPNEGAIDVQQDNPALTRAREFLAERNGKPQIDTDETQIRKPGSHDNE